MGKDITLVFIRSLACLQRMTSQVSFLLVYIAHQRMCLSSVVLDNLPLPVVSPEVIHH